MRRHRRIEPMISRFTVRHLNLSATTLFDGSIVSHTSYKNVLLLVRLMKVFAFYTSDKNYFSRKADRDKILASLTPDESHCFLSAVLC